MGAQSSKASDSIGHFTAEDTRYLKSILNGLSTSKEVSAVYDASDIKRHCKKYLDDWFTDALIDLTSDNSKGGTKHVSGQGLLEYLSLALLGTLEEKITSFVWLLKRSANGAATSAKVTTEELKNFSASVVRSYLRSSEYTKSFKSWQGSSPTKSQDIALLSEFLLTDLLYDSKSSKLILSTEPKNRSFGIDDLVQGFSKSPLLVNLISSVLSCCFEFNKTQYLLRLIPHAIQVKREFSPHEFTSLAIPEIKFINAQLPQEFQHQWRLLFSTLSHGESFSKMLGNILDRGPTVIIIKEENGHTFGAFTDAGWAVGPKFQGTGSSFMFHLKPKFVSYTATGFNDNYQYLNVQQQTFPNGLGIGGKIDYFGIWIDAEFGKATCSPTCTTFDSPQMSQNKEFAIGLLEVWGVGPEPEKEEGVREKSILDKDPEAQAILELMNKAPASDGYRDKKKVYEEDYDEDD